MCDLNCSNCGITRPLFCSNVTGHNHNHSTKNCYPSCKVKSLCSICKKELKKNESIEKVSIDNILICEECITKQILKN